MTDIIIDGSEGEGGGQILRTSLSLGAITGKTVRFENIRAKRRKPGLLRQHYTCVEAAKQACNAQVEGHELGSTTLTFKPGKISGGDFDFSIGSAGSTVLVAQTLLPILLFAPYASTARFKGGTHNDLSPSLCFFEHSYLAVLAQMGLNSKVTVESIGFNPAGGGSWQLDLSPCGKLKPLVLNTSAKGFAKQVQNCQVNALISRVPQAVGKREIEVILNKTQWPQECAQVRHVESPGPGNSVQVTIKADGYSHWIEMFGQQGVPAESIAKKAYKMLNKFVFSEAAVEEHLADQLLLPMALAGKGQFTTLKPSQHTLTNIEVIKRFLDVQIDVEQLSDLLWQISIK